MLKIKFLEKNKIAKNTWQFLFQKPLDFSFQAGQYVTIFLRNENRDFTICAKEKGEGYFSIVTKIGESTFKKNLFSVLPGEILEMEMPSGGFTLSKTKNPKVFLAGGIGMTPFYSMISSNDEAKTSMTLLVSFSKKDDVLFFDELQKISEANNRIRIIYMLSKEKWDRESGRISSKHIKKYVPELEKSEFMIAGGEKMVEDTEKLLLKMGIRPENIRIDIFTGYL